MRSRTRRTQAAALALAFLALCFVAACGGDDDDDADANGGSGEADAPAATAADLEAQPWQLRSYAVAGADDLTAASETDPATAEFANGVMSGSTGCNQYNVSYELGDDGAISFGDAASTQAFCAEVDAQEQAVLQAFDRVRRAVMDDTALQFLDAQGNPVLFFDPRET